MAKVNLGLLREARDLRGSALKVAADASGILLQHGEFCDICGETEPESGFYPSYAFGLNSVSRLICNDCDKELRTRNPQPAEDTRCPECLRELGNAVYGTRMTCGCGARLVMIMGGPSPRWEPIDSK